MTFVVLRRSRSILSPFAMLLNGNAVQLSKSYAKNTHSTTDYQKNFAALYRATPCAQSSADRDRSGCDEMPYIPMPEGRGFTAYLVKLTMSANKTVADSILSAIRFSPA